MCGSPHVQSAPTHANVFLVTKRGNHMELGDWVTTTLAYPAPPAPVCRRTASYVV